MVKRRPAGKPFRIIAHRCRDFGEKENSFAGLRKALASKVDGVEIDYVITCDRQLVVWHYASYRDADGKKHVIREETLADAERNGLMSLDTALATFKRNGEGKVLDIDIKAAGEERQLVRLIRKHGLEKRVTVVSWIGISLERVHRLAPRLPLSFTFIPKIRTHYRTNRIYWFSLFLPSILRRRIVPLRSVNLRNYLWPISRSIIKRLHARGCEVIVVNADTVRQNERLFRIGADGVMTNRAPELLAWRDGLTRG